MSAQSVPLRRVALITGASSGIGYELAKQFGRHGFDLLVTGAHEGIYEAARDFERLGVQVDAFQADLTRPESVEQLFGWATSTGRAVDAVAINAGIGVGGPFVETPLDKELSLIALNVASSVHLAKLTAKAMVTRGEGRILFTSSVASEMRSPFEAVYGASKAFLQSFSHSLRDELRDTGVTVTALIPGPTDTRFFHRAGMEDTRAGAGKKDSAAQVAKHGFDALMKGAPQVHAGAMKTRLMGYASRVLPEVVKMKMHRRLSEPGGARH